MEINKLLEAISFYDVATLVTIVGLVMAITKGLTELFNIKFGYQKQLVTIVVTLWLVIALYVTTVEQQSMSSTLIFKLINSIIFVFFGATGVYNLIPGDKITEIEVTDIPDFEQVSIVEGVDDENA